MPRGRGPAAELLSLAQPELHPQEQAPALAGFIFPGDSQDRQLSTPSRARPDPRRKQRDTDKWPDVPPCCLDQ